MSNKICPLPWNHLSVQQNGDFRMCCQCVHPPFGKTGMRVQDHSIDQARNSELHQRVRSQMLAGEEPAECQLCWDEERAGLPSKRLHMLKHYPIDNIQYLQSSVIDADIFPLEYIDLRFGNLCNMKCRSCGPWDSSLWYDDFVELTDSDNFNFYSTNNYQLKQINNTWTLKNDDFTWYQDEKFWDMMKHIVPNVNRLYLTGGEPLINKAQWRLLNSCIEMGVSKKIILEYNSNMTVIPENAFDIWSQFKEVHIGCSIDAVGDVAHYMRYPAKWEEVEENILKLGNAKCSNLLAKFAPTISVFNILELLRLTDWLRANRLPNIRPNPSFHILEGPHYQNIQVLPPDVKVWICDEYKKWYASAPWRRQFQLQFDNILNYMMAQDRSYALGELKTQTEKLDKIRGQNIADYVPWLAEILAKID